MDSTAIGILGAGRVGQALAELLGRTHTVRVAARSQTPTMWAAALECRRIIVAVPDAAISDVAAKLVGSGVETVLHTCGSQGPAALDPLPGRGVSCATFHPLQTFASAEAAVECLPGSAFGICGCGPARQWAEELCAELNGTPIAIPEEQLPLYHAAAVVAGNYTIGLVEVAANLMERAGVERETALKAIAPLVRTSVDNALIMGPETALTGPIERGDLATVQSHLEALRTGPTVTNDIYRVLGQQLVAIAERRGLDKQQAGQLDRILSSRTNSQIGRSDRQQYPHE